jgi:hypothetical protein
MRVRCVNSRLSDIIISGKLIKRDYLVLGQEYEVEESDSDLFNHLYWVTLDYGRPMVLIERGHFITIEEFREQKLNKLLWKS